MTKKTAVKVIWFCAAGMVFIGLDRITKQWAKANLMFKEPKVYWDNFFRFEYVENTGAALSLGDNLPQPWSFWLLSMIPLGVMLWLFVYVMREINNFTNFKLFCFAMIISGGLGNIIDRIIYDRRVTDFMNIGIGDIRTGIFNVADVWITSGVIGLFIVYNSKNKGLLKPDNVQKSF
jgi:signal peptidase II